MRLQNYKIEMSVLVVAMTMFGFFYLSSRPLNQSPEKSLFKTFEMGFEMARISVMEKFFSLEGREIVRNEESLPEKKEKVVPMAPLKKSVDAKTLEKKKLAEKNKAETQKKIEAAKAAAQRANAQRDSSRRNAQVVATGDRFKSHFKDFAEAHAHRLTEERAQNVAQPLPTQADPVVTNPNAKKDNESEMSLEAWKALLMTQPTPANAYKALDAFAKKKLSENDFYSLVNFLMQTNKSGHQKLALYMIYSLGNASSFAVVAGNYERIQSDVIVTADNFLMSYNSNGRINALAQILNGTDSKTQIKALAVVKEGLEKIRSGELPYSGVSGRDNPRGGVQSFDVKIYNALLAPLNRLGTSSVAQLSQGALQVLSLLQSVASN